MVVVDTKLWREGLMLRRALFLCMTKIREWLGENAFLCPTLQQIHSMCTPRTLLNDAKTLMVHPNSDTNYHMSNNLGIYLRIFLYHLDRREGHNWPKMTIDPNQMIFCNWATPFWPSIGVNKNHIKWYVQKKRGWKLNIDNITDRQVPGVLTLAGKSTMGENHRRTEHSTCFENQQSRDHTHLLGPEYPPQVITLDI